MPSQDGSAARTARRISAIDTLSEARTAARLSNASRSAATTAAPRGAAENLRRSVSHARMSAPAGAEPRPRAAVGMSGAQHSASEQRAKGAADSSAASKAPQRASNTAVFGTVNIGAQGQGAPVSSVGAAGSSSPVSSKTGGIISSVLSKARIADKKKIVRFAAAAAAALLLCAGIAVSAAVLSSNKHVDPLSADSVLGAAVVLDETNDSETSASDAGVLKASSDISDRYTVKFSFYDKPEVVCSTKGRTLDELVGLLGIELSDAQKTEADLSSFIDGDLNVAVDSVTYGTATAEESIDYETKYVDVDTIPRGSTKVQQAGSEGVRTVTYNVTYVNGVETAREKSGEYVSRQPTDRVIARGTGGTAVIGGVPSSYSYVLICDSTVYTGGGITASGLPATEQVIAVDPTVIPLGTRVYIEGIGYRIAADTGGLIKGNFIDIYYETSNPNFAGYGRRNVKVYILD